MKGFYKHISLFAVAVTAAILVSSCTNVDDTLGGSLIPGGGEKLEIRIDTIGLGANETIKAFQTYTDSIGLRGSTANTRGSMNTNVGYIGSMSDPLLGITCGASAFTGTPAEPYTPNFFKGRKGPFDSVKLVINMKLVGGNPSQKQTFNIYRLRDSLAYSTDTMNYQSFQYEKYIYEDPVFCFDYSGEPTDIEEIKLTILPAGEKLLEELYMADTMLFYNEKTLDFLEQFKGFVIAQAPGTTSDAALYANYLPNTNMNFYFQRERDEWEIELDTDDDDYKGEKEVTAAFQISFSDAEGTYNTSVACISHDYSGTQYAGLNDKQEIAVDGSAYIQGIGGMATVLEFPDGFFDAIEALKPTTDYGIFINQAQMYVWMTEHTIEAYDKAFQMLGSYTDYGRFTTIPDYYISGSSSIEVAYGGELNRTPGKGYYMMDISSFLQHALQNDDDESRRFTIAPTYSPYTPFSDYLSKIQVNGSSEPIRVKITYTLIAPDEK